MTAFNQSFPVRVHFHFSQTDKGTVCCNGAYDGVSKTQSATMKTEYQKKQKSKGMGNIKKLIGILNEMYDDRVEVSVQDVFDNGEGTRVILTLKKEQDANIEDHYR